MSDTPELAAAREVSPNAVALVRFQQEFVDGGDHSIVDDVLSEDFEVVRPGLASAVGALMAAGEIAQPALQADGLSKIAGLKAATASMRGAFGEWRHHDHRLIADGDVVSGHWKVTGKHTGEFFGVPATGRSFTFTEAGTVRFEGGKIKELWFISDSFEFLSGLGYALAGRSGGDAESWTEHPNVARIRRHYAAFTERDFDTLKAGYAENVVWTGPPIGSLEGRENVLGLIAGHWDKTEDNAGHEVQDIVGGAQHVVGFLRYRAERPDGRVISGLEAQVNRLNPDGTIAEVRTFLDDPEAFRRWAEGA
ncbi:MAG TPA: nuclear transport factor 2 family protein [Solirubrobacteraceae bacterium]|nr:nuclear transport factor 2 family protein [Solirubrobacteraceae bacterium]